MDNTTNNSVNSPVIDALASFFASQGYDVGLVNNKPEEKVIANYIHKDHLRVK